MAAGGADGDLLLLCTSFSSPALSCHICDKALSTAGTWSSNRDRRERPPSHWGSAGAPRLSRVSELRGP